MFLIFWFGTILCNDLIKIWTNVWLFSQGVGSRIVTCSHVYIWKVILTFNSIVFLGEILKCITFLPVIIHAFWFQLYMKMLFLIFSISLPDYCLSFNSHKYIESILLLVYCFIVEEVFFLFGFPSGRFILLLLFIILAL